MRISAWKKDKETTVILLDPVYKINTKYGLV